MARKNLLTRVTGLIGEAPENEARAGYATRGASRSMMLSIEEMAENAKRLVAGEAIVSLDPAVIDGSFVADRIEEDQEAFALLREGIREQGQLQPILVRPHPETAGRYMVVFGHRRTQVARELGIPVLAVVKNLEAIAHIVAQGQENSRRSNLSFIEKALFARKLQAMGQSKETIRSALGVDDTLLSRMLSVAEVVPPDLIEAIGAAKTVGRDRWEDLKKLLLMPDNAVAAAGVAATEAFRAADGAERVNQLLQALKPVRRAAAKPRDVTAGAWAPQDKRVAASFRSTAKSFSLALTSKDASEFGHYISSNLEELYQAFREAKHRNATGD